MRVRSLLLPPIVALCLAPPGLVAEELPSSSREVAQALDELRERYGLDAVRMQSHLLRYALEGGSILTASAGIRGFDEQEGGKRALVFRLETGIVYDDGTVAREEQPVRVWTEVVDPTLRQFSTLDVSADGVALEIAYQHATYASRSELLRAIKDRPPATDELHLRLRVADIVDFVHARLSAAELLQRSLVSLNGEPADLRLPPSAHERRASTPPPARFELMPKK
jgi:hypothetical protein